MSKGGTQMTITLKQARLIKEKRQKDLAKLLGIHVQTYRKLEQHPEELTIKQAKKICEFLKISYDDIFFTF